MIQLFASDLDGTLLNGFHLADPFIVGAIRKVVTSGRHFAIATGRFMKTNAAFGFEGIAIDSVCANGALIYTSEGDLLRHVPLDPAFVEELARSFPQIPFDFLGLRHAYTVESKEARLQSLADRGMIKALRARAMVYGNDGTWQYDVSLKQILDHEIVKANCRLIDKGLREELSAFLYEHRDTVTDAAYDAWTYEITRADINKGEAIAFLATELGIAEDEIAVYGDGGNDVAMLKRYAAYGNSFATHGACAAAVDAAAAQIGSNLAYAVPRHMLSLLKCS